MPVSDTALPILEKIQAVKELDFSVFQLSPEISNWLSKLAEGRELPANIRFV